MLTEQYKLFTLMLNTIWTALVCSPPTIELIVYYNK